MNWLFVAGGGAILLLIAFVIAYIVRIARRPVDLEARLEELIGGDASVATAEEAEELMRARPAVRFPFASLAEWLSRQRWARRYERRLIAAGIPLRPGEFASILVITPVLLGLPAWLLTNNLLFGAGAALIGWWLPHLFLNLRYNARRTKLENQLADALTVMSAAISAGFGFLQAMRLAAEQMPSPISEELERVARLSSLGMPMDQALQQLAMRVQSYDYDITVTAMNIQLRRGGNLTRLLDTIAETIRQRIDLRGEIAAATAQARLSGWVLMLLPVVVAGIASVLNWEYMQRLFTTPRGQMILKLVVGWQLMGVLWIRQLLKLDI